VHGWKDVIRFDVPGRFVYHCHVLEHEDTDMMRPFAVTVTGQRHAHVKGRAPPMAGPSPRPWRTRRISGPKAMSGAERVYLRRASSRSESHLC
jgi:hypothetical protein